MSRTHVPLSDEDRLARALSDEERLARARELAQRIRDRQRLEEEHQDQRARMRRATQDLDKAIRDLADAVRVGHEERAAPLGLFASPPGQGRVSAGAESVDGGGG